MGSFLSTPAPAPVPIPAPITTIAPAQQPTDYSLYTKIGAGFGVVIVILVILWLIFGGSSNTDAGSE